MIRAATYSDCWVELFHADGSLKGRIDSYYVCLAKVLLVIFLVLSLVIFPPLTSPSFLKFSLKFSFCSSVSSSSFSRYVLYRKMGYEDCLRVTPSKDWDTRGVDAIDARRWMCDCNARYKAGWGQIVVVTRFNSLTNSLDHLYMRAEVPPWTVEDVRAMHLEDTVATTTDTPQSFYEKIKRVVPSMTDLIVEAPPAWGTGRKGGTKFVDRALLESMPYFKWHQIFNMVGVEGPPEKVPKKKRR